MIECKNIEKPIKYTELCLTSRGSGVRIPQLPQDKSKKAAQKRLFYFYPFPLHDGKQTIVKPLSFPQKIPQSAATDFFAILLNNDLTQPISLYRSFRQG